MKVFVLQRWQSDYGPCWTNVGIVDNIYEAETWVQKSFADGYRRYQEFEIGDFYD